VLLCNEFLYKHRDTEVLLSWESGRRFSSTAEGKVKVRFFFDLYFETILLLWLEASTLCADEVLASSQSKVGAS